MASAFPQVPTRVACALTLKARSQEGQALGDAHSPHEKSESERGRPQKTRRAFSLRLIAASPPQPLPSTPPEKRTIVECDC